MNNPLMQPAGFSQAAPVPALIDPFGRHVTYLRISVTDRCDFRCVYCMAENMTFLPKKEILTLEEIDRVATAFIRRGVRKLRLTAASHWCGGISWAWSRRCRGIWDPARSRS